MIVEKITPEPKVVEIDKMSYKTAIIIGLFQALSIVPGTSRSGSTILGGMLIGTSRSVAAEFSFFLAITAVDTSCCEYDSILCGIPCVG